MTGAPPQEARTRLAAILRAARLRAMLIALALALPLALAATALGWRFGGTPLAVAAGTASLILCLVLAWRRARMHDARWLSRRLNAAMPALEDSVALVLEDSAGAALDRSRRDGVARQPDEARDRVVGPGLPLTPELRGVAPRTRLEQLQIHRIEQRIASSPMPVLRPAWPRRPLAAAWLGALVLTALAFLAPHLLARLSPPEASRPAPPATATTLREGALAIEAPAYTGRAPQRVSSLDATAPAGSRVVWTIRFDREPAQASLVFHDGSELPLRREGDAWRGERALDASVLYRVSVQGAPPVAPDRLHRIDAVPDRAPELIVRAPEQTLILHAADQNTWDLAFEARDDYGLRDAELSIAHAQGSGEQVAVTEHEVALDGGRDPHERRYEHSLDLEALGYAEGDDLIVRLSVADNREPEPNVASSASLILRWPPERSMESAGMEGAVQRAMPAYFRSQRQLIIDTEALIGERASVDAGRFEGRSDELGVDQRILRLRYGQFLGEEFDGGAGHAAPGTAESEQASEGESTESDGSAESPEMLPGHDEEGPARATEGFGDEGDVLSEFGHVHDEAEAATLLDPQTKEYLRAALNEMWQAELHLRQAEPERALPYEYKALDYIKQVQQAERIYLARVGLELPKLDDTRRLSGDRADLSDRSAPPPGPAADDTTIPAQWQALAEGARPDFAALETWVGAHEDGVPDALGLLMAIDALRRDPQCARCREDLQSRLWPLLPAPATGVAPRAAPDAAGAAYLDALGGERP